MIRGDWMAFEINEKSKEIIDSIYTDVIITDAEGIIIYANNSTKYWFDMEKEAIIGKSVLELEKQKVFSPSVTRKVLETGKKQTLVQTTNHQRKLLVTGNIIYDENQNLKYVVCYSQDITEFEKLKSYVHKVEGELVDIKKKLHDLRHRQATDTQIIVKSKQVEQIMSIMDRIAGTDATVLFTGESGVGKSLFAEQLHQKSGRDGKFIPINCSTIPESLIESELFGYKAGSFTGASQEGKVGFVEQAEGGTLFLDEIGELPIEVQAKLLMLIQNKTFYRVGDSEPRKVDFRLVAATNVNIEEQIKNGRFREDLYFRLSVIHLSIPPLRERQEDLLSLIIKFMDVFNTRYDDHKELTHETIDHLLRYTWPGNVRELSNAIERLVLTIDEDIILPEHLPENIKMAQSVPFYPIGQQSLPEIVEETEIRVLKQAREHCKSTTEMAAYLGVSQPTIVRKLQKYQL